VAFSCYVLVVVLVSELTMWDCSHASQFQQLGGGMLGLYAVYLGELHTRTDALDEWFGVLDQRGLDVGPGTLGDIDDPLHRGIRGAFDDFQVVHESILVYGRAVPGVPRDGTGIGPSLPRPSCGAADHVTCGQGFPYGTGPRPARAGDQRCNSDNSSASACP